MIVLFAVLFIIVLIMLINVKIDIEYTDKLIVYLKILFFKKNLYGDKKRFKEKDYRPSAIRKAIRKNDKKISESKNKKKKKKSISDIIDSLNQIRQIVSAVIGKFFKYLKINVTRMIIIVGSNDAAKTAVEFGIVVQSMQYLISLLDNISNFNVNENTEIYCGTDYLSDKIRADIKLVFSISVFRIICLGLIVLFTNASILLHNRRLENGRKQTE